MLAIAIGLCDDAVQKYQARVGHVAEWTVQYMRYLLVDAWMEASGGWVSVFTYFYCLGLVFM